MMKKKRERERERERERGISFFLSLLQKIRFNQIREIRSDDNDDLQFSHGSNILGYLRLSLDRVVRTRLGLDGVQHGRSPDLEETGDGSVQDFDREVVGQPESLEPELVAL